ncbi:hypothetical protein P3S67_008262 [Capsicum chacoense]
MAFQCMFRLAIFLVLPLSTIAQSYKNISLGSTLTTSDVTNFWPSPSGDFAFGFQRIGNGSSGFLLAIWFNKLKEKTVVWSANRNNIAPEGSKVELCIDGRLVLTDLNGQEIWVRDMARAGPAYGAMLDTGNFVLANSSSGIVRQSFDEPTDTILPGQVLDQRSRLVSSFSSMNASTGRFELFLDGELALYTIKYPIDATNDAVIYGIQRRRRKQTFEDINILLVYSFTSENINRQKTLILFLTRKLIKSYSTFN